MTMNPLLNKAMGKAEDKFHRLQNMVRALNLIFEPEEQSKERVSAMWGVIETLNDLLPEMLHALEEVRAVARAE
jgi:hypothetical protein